MSDTRLTLTADKTDATAIFKVGSRGLSTGRDAWCYSWGEKALWENVDTFTDTYHAARMGFAEWKHSLGDLTGKEADAARFLGEFPSYARRNEIAWSRHLRSSLVKDATIEHSRERIYRSLYRPFTKQYLYFDATLNDAQYHLASMFPTATTSNMGIIVGSNGVLATNAIPDYRVLTKAAFYPRYTFEGGEPIDNITDEALALFEDAFGRVTKDDIFNFVYAQLHVGKLEMPERKRFQGLKKAGQKLVTLHSGFEELEPYPVEITGGGGPVDKLKWGKKREVDTRKRVNDKTVIVVNKDVTVRGIPESAQRYVVGTRSALGWVVDRYRVHTDKASGIVNDLNEAGDARYVAELIAQVTRAAVETVEALDYLSQRG